MVSVADCIELSDREGGPHVVVADSMLKATPILTVIFGMN